MFLDAKEGVDSLISLEYPECEDWSLVQVYPKVLRLVSGINTNILVGNGLQENDEWIDISANSRAWKSHDHKKPLDSIEWIGDDANDPKDKNDPHLHAIVQLILGALSVHTTSQLITKSIFNLATWPEYVPILRQEIEATLREAGGKWTMESMAQLQELDSFKETPRHSGHLTLTFQRISWKAITLSDGTEIPEGYTVFPPANAINFDPELLTNPETLNGLRFYKLRHASPENEKKFQLISITKEELQFRMGRYACPGRWIASHQVKLILAHLLEKYEVKLKNGEGRPKTIFFQTNQFPDPQGEILFKNRK